MSKERPIPKFAVVGQPNEGKTSLISTLTEDDRAEISPIQGTTRILEEYPVFVDREKVLVFYDTPGFGRPGYALEWLRKHKDTANPARVFLESAEHKAKYPEECEIFKPIADGCAVIYVVDGSRPICDVDRHEGEILRLCGIHRLAIINSKKNGSKHIDEWKSHLRGDFSVVREFNACEARFADRIRLLGYARTVVSEWEEQIEQTIDALNARWDSRLEDSGKAMTEVFRSLLSFRSNVFYGEKITKEAAAKEASDKVPEHVRKLEKEFRDKIRKLFLISDEQWEMNPLLSEDVFCEEVWQLFGLSKSKLYFAAITGGAATGTYVDVATGFGTVGLGAIIGGLIGGASIWLGADHAVRLKTPEWKIGPFKLGGDPVGGTQIEASIAPDSKVPSILFDRMLLYIESASSWAHARPSKMPESPTKKEQESRINAMAKEDLARFTNYISLLDRKTSGRRFSESELEKTEGDLLKLILNHLRQFTNHRRPQSENRR